MANNLQPFQPIAGLDLETSEDSLDPGKVQGCANVLFERRQCISRPGASAAVGVTGIPATQPVWAQSFSAPGTVFTLMMTSTAGAGRLWSVANNGVATEITGPGFPATYPISATIVNAVILVSSGGTLLRSVLGTAVYTVIATATPKYIDAHLSRAVGSNVGNSFAQQITVVWSVAGDETTWTGATNGSGTSILSDADDEFTGCRVIHNAIVLPRRSGFHLGIPTGIAIPAFRFELWSRDDIGVIVPQSVAVYNNVMYFIGQDNVYTFDLQRITPVGDEIRLDLFSNLLGFGAGTFYNGFITQINFNGKVRSYYNLCPSGNGSDLAALYHYVYDIKEGTWSRHSYNSLTFGFPYMTSTLTRTCGLLKLPAATLTYWDQNVVCERAGSIVLPTFNILDQNKDILLERTLLRLRDYGVSNITVTVQNTQGKTVNTWNVSVPGGTAANDTLWKRWWVDLKTAAAAAGNDFRVTISFPANSRFACNYVGLWWGESGDYRG